MAWTLATSPIQCGINDIQLINFDSRHGVLATARQTTTFETGSAGVQATLNANGNKGVVPWGANPPTTQISVFTAYVGLSGSPSQEVALLWMDDNTLSGGSTYGKKMIGIQTDRSLVFYDHQGLPIYRAPDIVIPTSGGVKLTFVVDCLTLGPSSL